MSLSVEKNLIFDSHAHYDDHAFNEDRDRVLPGLVLNGVGNVVDVCAKLGDLEKVISLANKYDFMYAASGVHPSETAELNESNFTEIIESLKEPKVVAVGEVGLDYHWDEPSRDVQKKWFAMQIGLARQEKYPLIIHSRDAAADTLDMMKAENARDAGGVIHCFSYEKEMARIYLDMGFYLGIGGVLTFKNARKLKEVVEYMPIERMLLETDCPYLAPVPFRGKRNDSTMIKYVVEEIAQIKHMDIEEIIGVTAANATAMYRLN